MDKDKENEIEQDVNENLVDGNVVEKPKEFEIKSIEEDMKDSYLLYSMSVIVARALPDARDGFKPVHRRVMYSMHKLGVVPEKPTVKSARIVGDVIGKYHPHGDVAVYETLVRMAQKFSLRYPLVFGQGNFGSIDGDSAAAMRYTEAKMNKTGVLMLEELEKDTVNMRPNYDESLVEPVVLPSVIPNMIINGSTGIAVGMATSMAPHNLSEVTQAIHAYCDKIDMENAPYESSITGEELLQYVKGPDFPMGGLICGRSGIRDAYLTGRGRVRLRSHYTIEKMDKGKNRIIFTDIPYMVNKAETIAKIADLAKDKKIEGISDIRDESSKDIRVVIELKKDAEPDVVLNNLFKYTQFQTTFSIYNLALVNNKPKLLTLKDLIKIYVDHREEVVRRAAEFDLAKAQKRLHIVNALRVATQNIDEVVHIIRSSKDTTEARTRLQERFDFDAEQSNAIVEMRLGQLTGLNLEKLEQEYNELKLKIEDLEDFLNRYNRRIELVLKRLDEVVADIVRKTDGDKRRTEIGDAIDDVEDEDLIPEEEQVITISKEGYIKRLPIDTFKAQKRGGKGIIGSGLKDEDNVDQIFTASTHSMLLVFTNKGRVHWTKVYRLPSVDRGAKGVPIQNYINLAEGEKFQAVVPVRKFGEGFCLIFVTKCGRIIKMNLMNFAHPRSLGKNAIALVEGDELVQVKLMEIGNEIETEDVDLETPEVEEVDVVEVDDDADENAENTAPLSSGLIMLATKNGQAVTFPISKVPKRGVGSQGVRGIRLVGDDEVISLVILKEGEKILTITEKGYGKRSNPQTYRVTNRGSKGVKNLKVTEKIGSAVFVDAVADDYDLIVTTRNGQVIRVKAEGISVLSRNAQGVKVVNLNDGDIVQDATALPSAEDLEQDAEESKNAFEKIETPVEEVENTSPSIEDSLTENSEED